jgi:hypothetical protein
MESKYHNKVICQTIDSLIASFDNAQTPAFHCPEAQRKSYYLKCCHLLFVYQRLFRVRADDKVADAILLFKQLLPVLREAKL